jgi:hypothetical protein
MKLTGDGMSLPPRQIELDLRNGVPIGYLRPDSPATQAIFIDLGRPGAICCLALAQGPPPAILHHSIINTAPLIVTCPLIMERICHATLERDDQIVDRPPA